MSDEPAPLSRRLMAEALGSAILVATVVGSGIMAEQLAGGNQAIALLGNTIPTGAILVVLITILGPVSGAHFNPAVTLVFATRGETPWSEVVPYIVVQCVGAILGTVLAHLMFDVLHCNRDQGTQWAITVASGGGRDIHACAHHPWRSALRTLGNSMACRVSDHCRLLVHGVHIVCQSGCDNCSRVYDNLLRDRHQPRPWVHSRPIDRSSHGRSSIAIAFSCSSQVIRRSDGE